MKKSLTLFIVLLFSMFLVAAPSPVPQKLSYQAVIRNSSNELLTNQPVGIKISIIYSTPTGTVVYAETQNPTTNANGLISIAIGEGTVVTGTFSFIEWTAGPHFIKTEIDPTGGTVYTITSTNELLSVPYSITSLFAKNVESIPDNSVTSTKIVDGTIVASDMADMAVTSAIIQDGTIKTSDLAGDVINTFKIIDGAVSNADLADNSVTSLKITDGAIVTADLADQTVSTSKLGNLAVSTEKIQNGAILTDKLANSAVTAPKISSMGASAGQILMYSGTAWTPAAMAPYPWLTNGSNIYFNTGNVGIGTTIPSSALHVVGGSEIARFQSTSTSKWIALYQDNNRKGMLWSVNNDIKLKSDAGGIAFQTGGTLTDHVVITADGKTGIGDTTPDATLDVEGTVVFGSGGKVFSEIREIRGTTNVDGTYISLSYPTGYSMTNTRILSAEINYNGNNWNTLGMFNVASDNTVGCSMSSTGIYISYPDLATYHSRAIRILLIKVQ